MIKLDEAGIEMLAVEAVHSCPLTLEQVALVGSAWMFGEGEDLDILAYTPNYLHFTTMAASGWEPCWDITATSGEYMKEGRPSRAYRKGDANLILVGDLTIYEQWVKAAQLCKLLNLRDKNHRIGVHQFVIDGKSYNEVAGWFK